MLLQIVTLCVAYLTSTGALSVPHRPDTRQLSTHWNNSLARRNDTIALAGELTLNIDPDIEHPACGGIYEANINVAYTPDEFYLSTPCRNILNYLGGNKGSKDVNIIFACTGQGHGTGVGGRDTKLIFNIAASAVVDGASSATQLVPSNLQLVNEVDNTFISTQVNLGVRMSGNEPIFHYIYC